MAYHNRSAVADRGAEGRRAAATVAISHTAEKHRSLETVLPLVEDSINQIGGISRFVRPGQTVLIKPNVTVFYTADEGCTTDPYVVAALVRLCTKAGAKKVQVAESSGGMFDSVRNMKITGIAAAAEREGAELIDLGSDKTPLRTVPVPNGKVLHEVPLPIPLLEADVIIDAAKAKTHENTKITGALKNWVGVVNQHWRQHNHGADTCARFMDIMTVVPPDLCVVDAIICGEGDGPIANLPRWCGCVMATTDPVAADIAIARLFQHENWRELQYPREAVARGLGVMEPIEFIGTPLESVSFKAWHNHADINYLPINILVGNGVSMEGTIGHVKSALDSMLRRGELRQVIWLNGTPTIMIGAIEDPHFEKHLGEGPYLVFDDAALPKYKNDPRVYFVPGHPVLRTAMPSLMKGLGAKIPGTAILKWQEFQRWGMSNLQFGSPKRKVLTVAETMGAVAATALGLAAIVKIGRKL